MGRRFCCVHVRSARNPLGETCNWGMKAFLQRDYIVGVQRKKRVVREKVKESCRDQLSLATYQQAKTRAEGLQEQQRGE
jgi:hypothetical protein